MLEESATVVRTEGPWLWVETQPRSACSHCSSSGSCSTSMVARLFGAKRNALRLRNDLQATVGQQVVIGIPDEVLRAASFQAYLVPLVAMILGVVVALQLGFGDPGQALFAFLGLFSGLAWMGRVSGEASARKRYSPKLLRLSGQQGVPVELSEMTRSTS